AGTAGTAIVDAAKTADAVVVVGAVVEAMTAQAGPSNSATSETSARPASTANSRPPATAPQDWAAKFAALAAARNARAAEKARAASEAGTQSEASPLVFEETYICTGESDTQGGPRRVLSVQHTTHDRTGSAGKEPTPPPPADAEA
ncbi:hypothetical protein LTR28_013906, partial [Elasticomyces elasticus]